MNQAQYNAFCASLPAATHVVQWGGADVWKVGGKYAGITFKVSDIAYEVLRDQPGLRPAPYLASRGIKWIKQYDEPGLPDAQLKAQLSDSHRLMAAKLTRRARREPGLDPA